MDRTRVLFFWSSGILFPPLDDAIAAALPALGVAVPNWPDLSGYRELKENLTLGKVTDAEFCQALTGQLGLRDVPEDFCQRILNGLTLTPGSLEAMASLKSEVDGWLVVDLPEPWFAQLPFASEVIRHFSPERLVYLEHRHLWKLVPDVFYELPRLVQVRSDQCLLLDRDIKRTVQSINHGLPAAVIVSPERLRRELLLRKLATGEYCMHPRPV